MPRPSRATPPRATRRCKQLVAGICAAGAIPVILGGDHSVALPDMTAVAEHHGPGTVGVIHFDAHADTARPARFEPPTGRRCAWWSTNGAIRGRPVHPGRAARLVARGGRIRVDERERVPLVHDVRARRARLRVPAGRGDRGRQEWEHVFLSVDIDSLDPAYAPGTGTPEIGGLTTPRAGRGHAPHHRRASGCGIREWWRSHRPYDPTQITAVNAHRLVLEALSVWASPQRPRPSTGA